MYLTDAELSLKWAEIYLQWGQLIISWPMIIGLIVIFFLCSYKESIEKLLDRLDGWELPGSRATFSPQIHYRQFELKQAELIEVSSKTEHMKEEREKLIDELTRKAEAAGVETDELKNELQLREVELENLRHKEAEIRSQLEDANIYIQLDALSQDDFKILRMIVLTILNQKDIQAEQDVVQIAIDRLLTNKKIKETLNRLEIVDGSGTVTPTGRRILMMTANKINAN